MDIVVRLPCNIFAQMPGFYAKKSARQSLAGQTAMLSVKKIFTYSSTRSVERYASSIVK